MTKHITIELTDAQEAQLKVMAQREATSAEDLAADLVRRSLDYDAWYRVKVQEGLDDVAAGRILTTEQVDARSQARRADLLARSGKA